MNIIHAGGKIDEYCYTNSFESIEHHIQHNPSNIFELDVVKIKDGYVIAHDGQEKVYGYDGKFGDIEYVAYKELKVREKYTPMDFQTLKNITQDHPDKRFVLDIKGKGREYFEALEYIKHILKRNIEVLIPQVYCLEDLDSCIELGYTTCLVALWKCYGNIFSERCYEFFEHIKTKESAIEIFGVSTWYKNYHETEYGTFKSKVNYNIYFHGQNWHGHNVSDEDIAGYNKNGIFFFKHTV